MVRDLIAGIALIAVGLVWTGSVFLGDFSLLNIIFDGLGVFFIVRGLIAMNRAKRAADAPPPPR
jgi:hypothetical protein